MILICSGPAGAGELGHAFPLVQDVAAPFFDRSDYTSSVGSRFLASSPDAPSGFVERLGRNPTRICDMLDEAGFANSGWKSSALGGTGECLSATPVTGDGETEANSLFYMLRGRGNQRIDYARLKINLPQAEGAAEILAEATAFLEAFSRGTRTAPPDFVYTMLAKAEPFDIATRDVSYALKKEYDEPRYNLSIDFRPTPHAIYWAPDLGRYRTAFRKVASRQAAEVATTPKTSRLVRGSAQLSE